MLDALLAKTSGTAGAMAAVLQGVATAVLQAGAASTPLSPLLTSHVLQKVIITTIIIIITT